MEEIYKIRKLYQDAAVRITGTCETQIDLKDFEIKVRRTIKREQITAWLDKIIRNIDTYLRQPNNDYGKQLCFIKNQYPLIDVLLKVLNGQSYFVGIGHG